MKDCKEFFLDQLNPEAFLNHVKKLVKKYKKENTAITHTTALNKVSRDFGFNNYSHLLNETQGEK